MINGCNMQLADADDSLESGAKRSSRDHITCYAVFLRERVRKTRKTPLFIRPRMPLPSDMRDKSSLSNQR